jgi:hypothetical protein
MATIRHKSLPALPIGDEWLLAGILRLRSLRQSFPHNDGLSDRNESGFRFSFGGRNLAAFPVKFTLTFI